MPLYRSTSTYVMVLGTPENMAELNSWGVYPDSTMGDLSNTSFVYNISLQMITDIIPYSEFLIRFEECPPEGLEQAPSKEEPQPENPRPEDETQTDEPDVEVPSDEEPVSDESTDESNPKQSDTIE